MARHILTNAEMQAEINAGRRVLYKGRVLRTIDELPNDAQILLDYPLYGYNKPEGNAKAILGYEIYGTPNDGDTLVYDGVEKRWEFGAGGGGGSAPGGSGSELQYRVDASTLGGMAGSSVSGNELTIGGKLNVGPGDNYSFFEGAGISFDRVFSGVIDENNNGIYGLIVGQSVDPSSVTASNPQIVGGSFGINVPNTNSSNWHSISGIKGFVDYDGSGTAADVYGLSFPVYHGGSGNVTRLIGCNLYMQNWGTGTTSNLYGVYSGHYPSSGVITNSYAFYANSGWKHATVTNAYFIWLDSQGVWRINGDGIVAYYNPSFTKYTPGATNYERVVTQWASNVLQFTTEASGTGVRRNMEISAPTLTLTATNLVVSNTLGPNTSNQHIIPAVTSSTFAVLGAAQTWTGIQTYGSGLLRTTAPRITTGLADVNGNQIIDFTATGSAVNRVQITNAATTGNPDIAAVGSDSNISITLTPKGTGGISIPAPTTTTTLGSLRIANDVSGNLRAGILSTGNGTSLATYGNGGYSNNASLFSTSVGTMALAVGVNAVGGGGLSNMSPGQIGFANSNTTIDLLLRRNGPANIALGGIDGTTAVAQILSVQNITGVANTAGVDFTVKGSAGTGTGAGGSIIFQTAPASGSSSTTNSFVTALTINSAGQMLAGSDGSATAPIYSRAASTNTGIYFPGTNQVGIVANGTIVATFNSNTITYTSGITFNWNSDFFMRRAAAATLGLGAADSATPVAQTIVAQGSRGGTDSNVSGANLTIQSGNGTGNSTPSSLILRAPVPTTSGTGAQTQTTGLTIKNGTAVLTSYTVSNLPSAVTSGAGAVAFVTDANATMTAGIGTTVVGGGSNKVPVYSDGTNWIIG